MFWVGNGNMGPPSAASEGFANGLSCEGLSGALWKDGCAVALFASLKGEGRANWLLVCCCCVLWETGWLVGWMCEGDARVLAGSGITSGAWEGNPRNDVSGWTFRSTKFGSLAASMTGGRTSSIGLGLNPYWAGGQCVASSWTLLVTTHLYFFMGANVSKPVPGTTDQSRVLLFVPYFPFISVVRWRGKLALTPDHF